MRQTCHLRFPRHGEPDPPSSRMSWRFPISLRLYNLVYYVQMKSFRRLLIVLLLALSSLFVGCASTSDMKVLVSNYRDDYSIYCDGELACPTSYGCVVSVSLKKDKVELEARKNERTYGRLFVNRGEDSYEFNPWLLHRWPFLLSGTSRSDVSFFFIAGMIDVMILPVAIVEAVVPKKEPGKFPEAVVIPIDSSWVSPWEKPVSLEQ